MQVSTLVQVLLGMERDAGSPTLLVKWYRDSIVAENGESDEREELDRTYSCARTSSVVGVSGRSCRWSHNGQLVSGRL